MKLGTWILALLEPALAKILTSLGFSVVTVTGLTAVTNDLKAQAVSGLGLLSPEMLNLFLISGGATGLGIIFGACTTKLLLWQLQSATKILGSNPA